MELTPLKPEVVMMIAEFDHVHKQNVSNIQSTQHKILEFSPSSTVPFGCFDWWLLRLQIFRLGQLAVNFLVFSRNFIWIWIAAKDVSRYRLGLICRLMFPQFNLSAKTLQYKSLISCSLRISWGKYYLQFIFCYLHSHYLFYHII